MQPETHLASAATPRKRLVETLTECRHCFRSRVYFVHQTARHPGSPVGSVAMVISY
jgi:hypothetical protein